MSISFCCYTSGNFYQFVHINSQKCYKAHQCNDDSSPNHPECILYLTRRVLLQKCLLIRFQASFQSLIAVFSFYHFVVDILEYYWIRCRQQCFSPGFCIKFLLNFLLPSLFRCFRSPRLKLFTAGMAHPLIIGKSRTCSAQAAQYADRPENHHTAAGICKRSAAARMMNSHILRIFRTALWTLHAIPSPLLSYAQYIISSLICK